MQFVNVLAMAALASAAAVRRQTADVTYTEVDFFYDQACTAPNYFNTTIATPGCVDEDTGSTISTGEGGSFSLLEQTDACLTFFSGPCNASSEYEQYYSNDFDCHSYTLGFEPECVRIQTGVSECLEVTDDCTS